MMSASWPLQLLATVPTPGSIEDSLAGKAVTLLNQYAFVFLAAFVVTLLVTPLVRRVAIRFDIIDHPDQARKLHAYPVAYLGGVAVFCGLLVAIILSYASMRLNPDYESVPIAIVVGMIAIMFTGLADDVWGWDPRLKIAGQLVAAAALAIENVGVNVATGVMSPFLGGSEEILFSIGSRAILNEDLFYWTGTAIIAIFVLGACNAANFIDGLDGLLSGVVAVVAIGLLVICLLMAPLDDTAADRANTVAAEVQTQVEAYRTTTGRYPPGIVDGRSLVNLLDSSGYFEERPSLPKGWSLEYSAATGQVTPAGASLTGARIVLCLALLGAVLGFLPHNFNPASIFLGDCGSLLLGYMSIVIILMLGERGQTHLVFAGLIVFSIPIIDTTLAIIRRKLAGRSITSADSQHLHHQLKRTMGTVKRAVLTMYGLSIAFAVIGVSLAALVMQTRLSVRIIYVVAITLFGIVAAAAVKTARRQQIQLAITKAPSVADDASYEPAGSGESATPSADAVES